MKRHYNNKKIWESCLIMAPYMNSMSKNNDFLFLFFFKCDNYFVFFSKYPFVQFTMNFCFCHHNAILCQEKHQQVHYNKSPKYTRIFKSFYFLLQPNLANSSYLHTLIQLHHKIEKKTLRFTIKYSFQFFDVVSLASILKMIQH